MLKYRTTISMAAASARSLQRIGKQSPWRQLPQELLKRIALILHDWIPPIADALPPALDFEEEVIDLVEEGE